MLLGTIPVVWFCLWMLILIRGSMLSTGKSSTLTPAEIANSVWHVGSSSC
jgi:hypothetical protein